MFKHGQPSFWDKYQARDGNARERKTKGTQPSPKVGTPDAAKSKAGWAVKAGAFQNPWQYRSDYRATLPLPDTKKRKRDSGGAQSDAVDDPPNNNGYVYQRSQEYRRDACAYIIDKLRDLGFTGNINASNDYPCLLVQAPGMPTIDDSKDQSQLETNRKNWTHFVMAHFVGIANAIAIEKGVPIEIVMRASFGHFAPSAAPTGESFRINVGLIPKQYMDAIAEAIVKTQEIFDGPYKDVLAKTAPPDRWAALGQQYLAAFVQRKIAAETTGAAPSVAQIKKDLAAANGDAVKVFEKYGLTPKNKPQELAKAQNLWSWLWSTGDANGHTVMYQLTRRGQPRIEELADLAYKVTFENSSADKETLAEAFAEEVAEYGKRFSVSKGGALTFKKGKLAPTHDFSGREVPIDDDRFWGMFDLMMSALGGSYATVDKFAKSKSVNGLYEALERQNIAFIKKMAPRYLLDSQDGVGSDSEEEGKLEGGPKVYSKKVITATGLRAIHLAHYAGALMKGNKGGKIQVSNVSIVADKVYYETQDAFEQVPIVPKDKTTLTWKKNAQAPADATKVLFFDLNHCNTTQEKQPEPDYSRFDVVVLDHTSSTPTRVNEHLKKAFANDNVKAVFLVGSGLKNEQCGADINPYGTFRVITRDEATRNRIYGAVVDAEKGYSHPRESHAIRKAYKSIGAVLTTKAIFNPGTIEDSSTQTTRQALASHLWTAREPDKREPAKKRPRKARASNPRTTTTTTTTVTSPQDSAGTKPPKKRAKKSTAQAPMHHTTHRVNTQERNAGTKKLQPGAKPSGPRGKNNKK